MFCLNNKIHFSLDNANNSASFKRKMVLNHRFCSFTTTNKLVNEAANDSARVSGQDRKKTVCARNQSDCRICRIPPARKLKKNNNNRLLTEREGRIGKYWPEVVAVRTERSEVSTATTEGQCSPVGLEQARLVSCLLYDTRLRIVKCTSGGLHLKRFRRDVFS